MAPNPLSFADIEAFLRITGEELEPWEARAIRAVDDAYMSSLTADKEGTANG